MRHANGRFRGGVKISVGLLVALVGFFLGLGIGGLGFGSPEGVAVVREAPEPRSPEPRRPGPRRPEAVLDRARLDYPEDPHPDAPADPGRSERQLTTGRLVAVVDAELLEREGEAVVRFTLSALGPAVEAPEGYRGVGGANRITARELELLVDRRELTLRVASEGGCCRSVPLGWSDVDATWGVLPERSVPMPHRRGEVPQARGEGGAEPPHLVTALALETPPLLPGRSRIDLLVRGVPRLRAAVSWQRVTPSAAAPPELASASLAQLAAPAPVHGVVGGGSILRLEALASSGIPSTSPRIRLPEGVQLDEDVLARLAAFEARRSR